MPTAPPPVVPAIPASTTANARWGCWPWDCIQLKRAREIWDQRSNQEKVIVAVIDDGFDLHHPALKDNLWKMPGQPDVHGWDFVDGEEDPSPASETPVSSHGTMVAGIVGGRPEPASSFEGVAPNAELMLLRWRSSYPPEAHANPANMAAALRFAVSQGARIVNLSAGIDTARKSSPALAELETAFRLAEANNVLVVVAAPNLPWDMDNVTDWLPGSYHLNNIIHVTGICRELRLLGAWGRKSVDLAAPAEDILGPVPGGRYGLGCATSFAAPLVAGALALVWGLLPKLKAEQLRHIVLRGAKSTPQPAPLMDSSRARGTHEVWGHEFPATPQGRLDLGFVEEACQGHRGGRGNTEAMAHL